MRSLQEKRDWNYLWPFRKGFFVPFFIFVIYCFKKKWDRERKERFCTLSYYGCESLRPTKCEIRKWNKAFHIIHTIEWKIFRYFIWKGKCNFLYNFFFFFINFVYWILYIRKYMYQALGAIQALRKIDFGILLSCKEKRTENEYIKYLMKPIRAWSQYN